MSPQAQGSNAQLLMAFEDSYGVAPSTPTVYKVPIINSGLKSDQSLQDDETIRNDKNPAKPTRGNINVSGSAEVYIDEANIGLWLKAMFGAPTTTDSDADGLDVEHVFTLAADQPSMMLEQGFTDISQYEQFNGCKVSKFSTELGGEGDVRGTIDLIGAEENIVTTTLESAPTSLPYSKFSQFQATIEEGGSSIATVTKASIDVEFNLDDSDNNYPIGNNGIKAQLPDGIAKVSGQITAWFTDKTLLDKAINGTETSLKLGLVNGTNSLEFFMPEVIFERNSPGIDGPQGIMIELPYQAYFEDNAEGTALKTTLINDQASY